MITLSAAAQPGGHPKHDHPGPFGENVQPKQLTVEEEAQWKVDQMTSELQLTDKQVKKLLKFHKKDIQYRRDNFELAGGPRPGFQGERPQLPPQGQRPPQGDVRNGGFPGGGPGVGGPKGGFPPQMDGKKMDFEKIEKYNLKQEKKLKKILGDELYTQWQSSHCCKK